jgi:DNA-binding LacI/PurR family transcriptional regulator
MAESRDQAARRPLPHVGIVFAKYSDPLRDPLTVRLFEGIHEVLREGGVVSTTYGLTCVRGNDYEAMARDVEIMDFDAVLTAPSPVREVAEALGSRRLLLQVGYFLPGEGASYVGGDLDAGTRKALAELARLGHRRVGFVRPGGGEAADGVEGAKVESFLREADALGIGTVVVPVDGMGDLLASAGRPTALFTSQTGLARGALKRTAELGIRVPDELSLVSYDDGDIGEGTEPRFSGIRVLSREIGRRGAEVLRGLLDGSLEPPVRETFEPELILRDTCAPAPVRGRG